MNDLKAKWNEQEVPIKIGIVVGVVIAALIVVLKILPALVASMGVGLLLVILFVPYWAPTIIAFVRKHPSAPAILALNLFFGWTFVGWILCLVWALSDNTGRAGPTVIVNTTLAPSMSNVGTTPHTQQPPQYHVGDVVNGHRFNGAAWIPLQPTATAEAPRQHQVGDREGAWRSARSAQTHQRGSRSVPSLHQS